MADLIANTLVLNTSTEVTLGIQAILRPDLPTADPNELLEYVVVVKRGTTIDQLEDDLRRDTSEDDGVDSSQVPDRPVSVANPRPINARQTHFMMTWSEAQALKNHPDVEGVELANSVMAETNVSRSQNFEKVGYFASNVGNATNYGLYRCNFIDNIYANANVSVATMNQNLDGTGVDVVIMDDGVLVDHPEWIGPDGRNRFIQIDWYAAAGLGNTMPTGYYDTPASGHGTCVASVVAGKTYGWATNANIYSLKTLGSGALLPHAEALDLVRQWHLNKPTNPNTGEKNPTIVNASWGVVDYMLGAQPGGDYDPFAGHTVYPNYNVWSGSYRGSVWNSSTDGIGTYVLPQIDRGGLGLRLHSTGYSLGAANVTGNLYYVTGKNIAIDSAVEDLIDAGVSFVCPAGNDRFKNDGPGGADWDNYVEILNTSSPITLRTVYYNRPSTPWANGAIRVGAVDWDYYANTTTEWRAEYSGQGTAIDIYAPGTGIVGAYVPTNGEPYYANSSYYQKSEQGTSFSCPQVAGVLALFMQANPGVSPAEAKRWLSRVAATDVIYDDGLSNNYAIVSRSLGGGPNKHLYNPYNKAEVKLEILGGITMSNVVPSAAATGNITRP